LGIKSINIVTWLAAHFTNRGKALAHYRSGMAKARKHDREGAIDEYTTVIQTPNITPALKAMALYNRALVYAATGRESHAIKDLDTVLAIKHPLSRIKTEASRKLVRMKRRNEKTAQDGA
jgi:hypothetical protein